MTCDTMDASFVLSEDLNTHGMLTVAQCNADIRALTGPRVEKLVEGAYSHHPETAVILHASGSFHHHFSSKEMNTNENCLVPWTGRG